MSGSRELIEHLQRDCPALEILLDPQDRSSYEHGARYGEGVAAAVVRPGATREVQAVMRAAQRFQVRLVSQGANTGLVAAATPDTSGTQIVLSTAKLKGAIEVDVLNQSVRVPAGTLLSELNAKLEADGLFFPIDLGADPSIGGMIGANTGGARLLKYGDVRQNLLGLEAVLAEPAGEVVDLMRPLRKNNVGFDFKQLFVGTSGAFGVVTAATLRVHPLPKQTASALIVPANDAALEPLLLALNNTFSDFLSSCEGISRAAANAVAQHIPGIENPFDEMTEADYGLLVELSSTSPKMDGKLDLEIMLRAFLEQQFGNTVGNAIVGKPEAFWRLRHSITDAIRGLGKVIAFDLSVPRSRFSRFRTTAKQLIADKYPWLQVYDFGHLGDGGVHLNMVWPTADAPRYDEFAVESLRAEIYDLTVRHFEGSFSAEHGVGPYNAHFYQEFTSRTVLAHVGTLQSQLDPRETLGRTWFGLIE